MLGIHFNSIFDGEFHIGNKKIDGKKFKGSSLKDTPAAEIYELIKKEQKKDAKNKDHYNNEMFTGYDMDRTMLRIGAMNMITHGIENPNIEYRDSLSEQNSDANTKNSFYGRIINP